MLCFDVSGKSSQTGANLPNNLAKVGVGGSNPLARSNEVKGLLEQVGKPQKC